MPQWLTMSEAIAHGRAGASIWQWASTDDGVDPDVVLVGIGDNPTLEIMAATSLLRKDLPELRVRVVNVTDLLVLEQDSAHPHGLDDELFSALFTADSPVIINFHGYPSAVKHLLFGRHHVNRFQGNERAKLAFAIYIHRLRSCIGSMIAVLGGLDALVFAGGVGENDVALRTAVCESFAFLGLHLDEQKNAQSPSDQDISAPDSTAGIVIVQTQEDWSLAKECWRLGKR